MSQDEHTELLHSIGGRPLASVLADQVPGFLFEGCFRDRSITIFQAPAHRGKTLLMLDMAICLDWELPLFDRFAPIRNRRVFFLSCDAPSWDIGLQTRKLLIGHGIPPEQRELLGINGIWRRGVDITDPTVREWLGQWKRETDTDVLFIDSYRATNNADENSTRETKQVMDVLCKMRDSGWCIIIAHHMGKATEVSQSDVHAGRGSTVISDSADFIYNLNKRNRKDNRVKVSCSKGRGSADDDDPFTFFDIEPIECGEHLNGRPLYGLRLVASIENALEAIRLAAETQAVDREALCSAVRIKCPDTCKDMTATQLYRFTDNKLQELQRLGRMKSVERGLWRAS